jgi:hypothetical protein
MMLKWYNINKKKEGKPMTERLRALVAEIEKLPPEQQDQWAQVFAQELADDQRWDTLFARPESQAFFDELIAEAEQGKRDGTLKEVSDTW